MVLTGLVPSLKGLTFYCPALANGRLERGTQIHEGSRTHSFEKSE
jgi:hypothetical protein